MFYAKSIVDYILQFDIQINDLLAPKPIYNVPLSELKHYVIQLVEWVL